MQRLATILRPALCAAGQYSTVPVLAAKAQLQHSATILTPATTLTRKITSGRYFATKAKPHDEQPSYLVVSLVGKDRVGVIRDFAKYLASLGANVEESRMSRLGGEFAMIVLISLRGAEPTKFLENVQKAFPGFAIHSSLTQDIPHPSESSPSLIPMEIEVCYSIGSQQAHLTHGPWQVEGPDSSGIVFAVTEKLAENDITIDSVDTETTSAAFAGYPIFRMFLRAHMTEDKIVPLQKSLEEVEDRFGVDIMFYDADEDFVDFDEETKVEEPPAPSKPAAKDGKKKKQ
ncbi:hypothetical protein BJ742DRAFT_490296 [Cladochytrium replicatum]|nr:hypothetical protein BJ742DRAFT_490296 [Cladochytrium replicatum]